MRRNIAIVIHNICSCEWIVDRYQIHVQPLKSQPPSPSDLGSSQDIEFDPAGQPHDAYFKRVFSDITTATQFFQSHLPALLAREIDWPSLSLVPSTFIERSLRQSHADLLFSVQSLEQTVFLFLLFEHQTSVDPTMPLRMLTYMTEIWCSACDRDGLPLPPILPFVLHQGPKRWNVSTQFADLFKLPLSLQEGMKRFLPTFQHALLDLTRVDPTTAESHDSLRMVLQLMKLARKKNQLLKFFDWLGTALISVPETLLKLSLLYALHTDKHLDVEQIAFKLKSNPAMKKTSMTLAEKLKHQGMWIGKIQMLETFLKLQQTNEAELGFLTTLQLEQRFNELQEEYSARFKANR